jgi:iron-sulfur cluster assembly protein
MASAQLEGNITLTNAALLAFQNFSVTEEADHFRVQVLPGGCSGFKYDIGAVNADDISEDDIILTQENISLVVDPYSIQYLDGTLIHYVKTPMQSGFTFQNPNATGGCGCGSSFNA